VGPASPGLAGIWTRVDGLRVYARISTRAVSPGPPVVLVHGLGVSSRYMIPTARLLARDYRVYAPDLPGSGRSEKPLWVLDIDGLADALAGWLRATNLSGATLVGNSLGCQTIAALALRHPALVARAVLIGPTMYRGARTALQQCWRLLLDSVRESPTLPPLTLFDYGVTGPWRAWRTLHFGLRDPLEAKLPRVQIPVLVVRGERDPIAPQAWAEEVAHLLPYGRLAVIPGGAHAVNYSTPERLVRVLRPFLRASVSHRGAAAR
jgi:2-hydroxy-6-oxonona-2,4-dienedioate hydrolase